MTLVMQLVLHIGCPMIRCPRLPRFLRRFQLRESKRGLNSGFCLAAVVTWDFFKPNSHQFVI